MKPGKERIAAYRAHHKAAGTEDITREKGPRNRDKGPRLRDQGPRTRDQLRKALSYKQARHPFVGCDGEGAGTDELGRQQYMLFRMGEAELYTGKPLILEEILHFIVNQPQGPIYVMFGMGYDATQILRSMSTERIRHLLREKGSLSDEENRKRSRYTWYKNYDIEYLQGNYLKVRAVKIRNYPDGTEKREPIKGCTRTIYETFGNFQKSFLKTLEDFNIGTEAQRQLIAVSKEQRGGNDWTIDQKTRDYCALECALLSDLMEKFRLNAYGAGVVPRTWNGAGKMAASLHSKHHTPRRDHLQATIPSPVLDYANMAYYGGRFEVPYHGMLEGTLNEYDISSAYPDGMRFLPCLMHGEWARLDADTVPKGIYVALVQFKALGKVSLGGFPVRHPKGHIYWPREGSGVYWCHEIESAQRLGFRVTYPSGASSGKKMAYQYIKRCDCKPFDWIEEYYEQRKRLGNEEGYPLKLAINALYGKLAQRRGNGVYSDLISAGLTTAYVRARLNDAIALAPDQIVMIATDGIYSRVPLPLTLGNALGEWKHEELPGMFIVQPGFYWSPGLKAKRKARGISGKFFETNDNTDKFERCWETFREGINSGLEMHEAARLASDTRANSIGPFPIVDLSITTFIGMKLANAWGKPDMAGQWLTQPRGFSFDPVNKREYRTGQWIGQAFNSSILEGGPGRAHLSLPHGDFLKSRALKAYEMDRLLLQDQRDYFDLGTPFRD